MEERQRLVDEFYRFLIGRLGLKSSTAENHAYNIGKFLREIGKNVNGDVISDYLLGIPNNSTRSNYVKAFKRFFRDFLKTSLVDDFKQPTPNENPTPCPSDEAVRSVFYELQYLRDKLIYLIIATSGLRKGEALGLRGRHINLALRSIVIYKNSKTKRTGITFYNEEVEALIKEYWNGSQITPETRFYPNTELAFRKQLNKACRNARVKVTAQMLRVWFCNKMGELGVQDRYIDIFCGRAPKSVLAKHYTSREIQKLKAVYDRADLKVLA